MLINLYLITIIIYLIGMLEGITRISRRILERGIDIRSIKRLNPKWVNNIIMVINGVIPIWNILVGITAAFAPTRFIDNAINNRTRGLS